jgi:hypothetical protein
MTDRLHAVVIHSGSPPELPALLRDYLQTHDPIMKFVLCSEIDAVGSFVRCRLVQNDSNKLDWVQIPTGCIVAIADLSKSNPPGFLSGAQ